MPTSRGPGELERVVVINLARRPDRMHRVVGALEAAGLSPRSEMYRAYDALEMDDGLLARSGLRLFPRWERRRADRMFDARPLKQGEVGCALSHLMVWRMIVARGWRTTLVLEDDVDVLPDLGVRARSLVRRLSRARPAWDLLYLGRNRLVGPPYTDASPPPEPVVVKGAVVPGFSYCAHAYVLSLVGAQRLLDAGFERAMCAVDEFLPALYSRHPRADVRRTFGEGDKLQAFAAEPILVRVRDAGSDTEASRYTPGSEAPRFRWLVGRARIVDDNGAVSIVAGKDALTVHASMRELARRLVALTEPSVAALPRSFAPQTSQAEWLLFRLVSAGLLARL